MHLPHADVELLFQFKNVGTTVKIASWNVNSVRARLQNILEWLSYSEIEVLLIQEIMIKGVINEILAINSSIFLVQYPGRGR